MAKLKKADFLDASASYNTRGKRINWLTDGQPGEALNIDLFDSVPLFDEAGSRANLDTGTSEWKDEVGLVAITTPIKAKAGTSGFEADRTLVVEASQLPTTTIGPDQAITGTQVPRTSTPFLDTTADVGVSGRNSYVVAITATLLGWFQDVSDAIDTVFADVVTNTADIATNTADIATNTADVATNTADVTTNAGNIGTNSSNISTNSGNISTNATGISTNAGDIATNTADIATNTADIATNVTDIATNLASIAVLSSKVGAMTMVQLALPVWDMDANATAIVTHGLSPTELLTISGISVTIFPDSGTAIYSLDAIDSADALQGGVESLSATLINLRRTATGLFDAVGFASLGTARGLLRFHYIAD